MLESKIQKIKTITMKKGNAKATNPTAIELQAALNAIMPQFIPSQQVFYVDERARKIVTGFVDESRTRVRAHYEPDSKTPEFVISFTYSVATNLGMVEKAQEELIETFKEAAYKLALISAE
jgi:hypothetical protein